VLGSVTYCLRYFKLKANGKPERHPSSARDPAVLSNAAMTSIARWMAMGEFHDLASFPRLLPHPDRRPRAATAL